MLKNAPATVFSRSSSRADVSGLDPTVFLELIQQHRCEPWTLLRENTFTSTTPTVSERTEEFTLWPREGWGDSRLEDNEAVRNTRATTETATKVSSVHRLLRLHNRDDRIARLSPEHRKLFEDIMALREEIGPVDFDLVKELQELRSDE